jgi:hypothetical protein
MHDHESADPGPGFPVNRVFPQAGEKNLRPRDALRGRPNFGDVGRKLGVVHTYQATYGMVRLEVERFGRDPEAIRTEYMGRAELASRIIMKELGDATRDALEDALTGRPPRF